MIDLSNPQASLAWRALQAANQDKIDVTAISSASQLKSIKHGLE
jgi:hypothetical protein